MTGADISDIIAASMFKEGFLDLLRHQETTPVKRVRTAHPSLRWRGGLIMGGGLMLALGLSTLVIACAPTMASENPKPKPSRSPSTQSQLIDPVAAFISESCSMYNKRMVLEAEEPNYKIQFFLNDRMNVSDSGAIFYTMKASQNSDGVPVIHDFEEDSWKLSFSWANYPDADLLINGAFWNNGELRLMWRSELVPINLEENHQYTFCWDGQEKRRAALDGGRIRVIPLINLPPHPQLTL